MWNSTKWFSVKLRKQWKPEEFQECWLCHVQSQQSSSHTSKPQNRKLIITVTLLQFSFLMPYWVFPHNTTFHKYFWFSWFCECHRLSTVSNFYRRGFCLRRHCNFLSTDSKVRVTNQAIKMSSFFDWFLFKKYFQIDSYKAIASTNLKVMKMTQEFIRLLRKSWLNYE